MIDTSRRVGGTWPDPAKQQPYRYGRNECGRFASVPYASLTQSEIDAMAATCDANGLNYTVENTFGGKSTITIEFPFNNASAFAQPATTEAEQLWEIVPTKQFKDILDSRNQLVTAMLGSALGRQEITLLRGWRRKNILEEKLTDDNGNFVRPDVPGSSGGSGTPFSLFGTVLAKYLFDGVEQVEVPAPTLTYTLTVTAQYINPAGFSNVGRIYASTSLVSIYGIPTTVLFDFPHDTDPAPEPIGATGFSQTKQYGWLKNAPSVRQISARKWNITQTWDYGLYGIELVGPRL